MAGKFEIYQDKAGGFRFRLKAGNGQNIGSSQGYKSKTAALKGIDSVRANAGNEEQYVVKENQNGKFSFNLKAKNHQIILSSQAYTTESGAQKGVKSVMQNGLDASLVEV